ncbi:TIGR04222 domain-containing membrane protein [Actinomadura barringtoniae]|uniref:TIGR04222 domain-containing membrane protein n=1 Tax=Actinomadura barringtoniae TaxID=1427535 RepID=A0A939T4G5_9ACTN|nr:TIGR04222 domain-containing membrane protein [Actinomadura barringtoniae]MBO2452526.1 TIGR04222 domain-containing membrane protein [Actinomadura barringtoniae]
MGPSKGDLWGISDQTFLIAYASAGVVCLVLALAVRIAVRGGHPATREIHPYEASYLTGGGRHAIATSLMALRLDGAVDVTPDGQVWAAGPLRTATTPLDQAIHAAVQRGEGGTTARLTVDDGVRQAIEDLRDGLAVQGLALSKSGRRTVYLASLPLKAVILLGLVRWVWMIFDHHMSARAFLVFPVIFVLVAAFNLVGGKDRETTRAGRAALRELAERNAHLDPKMSPAWATYGIGGAALGVALFGTAALMSIDPAFSQTMGLGRYLQLAGSSASSGWSGSSSSSSSGVVCSSTASVCSSSGCGGGSSCGGGGSSCGGGSGCGSSCGGGSGCGGGGG